MMTFEERRKAALRASRWVAPEDVLEFAIEAFCAGDTLYVIDCYDPLHLNGLHSHRESCYVPLLPKGDT